MLNVFISRKFGRHSTWFVEIVRMRTFKLLTATMVPILGPRVIEVPLSTLEQLASLVAHTERIIRSADLFQLFQQKCLTEKVKNTKYSNCMRFRPIPIFGAPFMYFLGAQGALSNLNGGLSS